MATESKDMENGQNGLQHIESEEALRNALSKSMTLSPDLYERLFLAPKNQVSGDLRRTFANPTPIAIVGFAVGLFPLSIELIGLRGSGGTFGTATTTCSIFFGGVMLTLGGLGEFLLGNTFPMVVFISYGAHFFTFATVFIPWFSAIQWNTADTSGVGSNASAFAPGATFAAGFGFYPLALSMLSFCFLICSLRTNLVFVLVFICATIGFAFACASLWFTALGMTSAAGTMLVATGGAFFAADLLGWYLLYAIMFATMELPIPDLPVFDLSTVIKAKNRKQD